MYFKAIPTSHALDHFQIRSTFKKYWALNKTLHWWCIWASFCFIIPVVLYMLIGECSEWRNKWKITFFTYCDLSSFIYLVWLNLQSCLINFDILVLVFLLVLGLRSMYIKVDWVLYSMLLYHQFCSCMVTILINLSYLWN